MSKLTVSFPHSSGSHFPHKGALRRKSTWSSDSSRWPAPTFLGRRRENPANSESPTTIILLLKAQRKHKFKMLLLWKVFWPFPGSIWFGLCLVNKLLMLRPVGTHHWSVFPENPEGWPVSWSRTGSQPRVSLSAPSSHCPGSPALLSGTCGTGYWDFPGSYWCCFADSEVLFVCPKNKSLPWRIFITFKRNIPPSTLWNVFWKAMLLKSTQ